MSNTKICEDFKLREGCTMLANTEHDILDADNNLKHVLLADETVCRGAAGRGNAEAG